MTQAECAVCIHLFLLLLFKSSCGAWCNWPRLVQVNSPGEQKGENASNSETPEQSIALGLAFVHFVLADYIYYFKTFRLVCIVFFMTISYFPSILLQSIIWYLQYTVINHLLLLLHSISPVLSSIFKHNFIMIIVQEVMAIIFCI